jgi:hypothetical protein
MFNWDNAPKWAQWVAMDESLASGTGTNLDQNLRLNMGLGTSDGRFKMIVLDDIDYENTLEARP